MKYDNGLIIGKFYPPHMGHVYLIDTGQARAKNLTVIVCDQEGESPPASLRAHWIQEMFPKVKVLVKKTTGYPEYDSQFWAKKTVDWVGKPDVVFTSEEYGVTWAAMLGCDHVQLDINRITYPISGTQVRSNPNLYLNYLPPVVKAYYMPRVVVIGAESTGTTTLTKDLARIYKTEWVPEFGRAWGETYHVPNDEWYTDEFVTIARMQNYLENEAAKKAKRVLFCDTDAFATGIWHEYYFGDRSPKVEELDVYDHSIYLLTHYEGVPFTQDPYGMRELRQTREWFHERTIERLEETGKRYEVIWGTPQERLDKAIHYVGEILQPSIT